MAKQQLDLFRGSQAAADYLKVSVRAIDRYKKKGLLPSNEIWEVSETDGRKHRISTYTRADLDAVKEKMIATSEGKLTALARTDNATRQIVGLSSPEALKQFAADLGASIVAAQQQATAQAATPSPAVPLADKLTLSLADAAHVAGLSKNFLRAAMTAKKLRAAKRGRGWNVKRADLNDYIKKL